MARIRTVKPEFWEDEAVGLLSFGARLTFLACLNMADDEGLLRWTPAYIKSNVFVYDDPPLEQVRGFMVELENVGMIYSYKGGKTQQRLAYVVNFLKHQKINRPSPPKLPAPSLQNGEVRVMYAQRDNWRCYLCGVVIVPADLSIDHVVPQASGGSDYPSNVAATHLSCNKSKRDKPFLGSRSDSVNDSVSDSVNDSMREGKGREGKGKEWIGSGMDGDDVSHRRPDEGWSEYFARIAGETDGGV